LRCFIAIDLPEHAKSRIFHEIESLKKKNLFDGTFSGKDNIHLTMGFLGDLTSEKIEIVKKKLREVDFTTFKCRVGKSGLFDDEKRIRVIWLEIFSEHLLKFEKEISEKLPEFFSDYENFSPHVTIARVKSVYDRKGLLENIRNIRVKNLDFEVSEFFLMKSELTQGGPKHKILEKFDLR